MLGAAESLAEIGMTAAVANRSNGADEKCICELCECGYVGSAAVNVIGISKYFETKHRFTEIIIALMMWDFKLVMVKLPSNPNMEICMFRKGLYKPKPFKDLEVISPMRAKWLKIPHI